jgi:hypothetical protein
MGSRYVVGMQWVRALCTVYYVLGIVYWVLGKGHSAV